MLIVYMVAALVGGLVSCVLLWPYGAAIALLSMPFGGSLFALLAAILVYLRTSDESALSADRAVYVDQPQKLQTTESLQ
jgi:Zn-dependent protease with chaperone function